MAIRIEGNSNRRSAKRTDAVDISADKVHKSGSAQFNTHLDRSFSHHQEELLFQMARDIEEQGKRLNDHIDIAELKVYKRMIANFIEEAVVEFGKFSKESFLDRRGRHRVYATVKRINETIETLTAEVLKNEKDHISIANSISDIRGLVLDLFL